MLGTSAFKDTTRHHNQKNPLANIALITGVSRGLGRSMALHLAHRGVDIIGTYHSNVDAATAVAREIEECGRSAAMLQLDTGQTGTFNEFVKTVTRTLDEMFHASRIQYLVNNAGYGFNTPFSDTTEADFDRLVAVQYKGPYFLTQRLLPLIVDGGRILFISSGLIRFSIPGYSAYASTKAGIEIVSRYLAAELADRGIRVNVVAPGVTESDFAGGVVRDNPQANSALAKTISLGRVGLPDDIGTAVASLLTGEFGWVTGQRIEVSGVQNL